jgi:hypothetical protein
LQWIISFTAFFTGRCKINDDETLGSLTVEEDQLSELGAHGSDGQDVSAVKNALLKHE